MELKGYNEKAASRDKALKEGFQLYADFSSTVNWQIGQHLSALSNEPTWGFLHYMFERANKHIEGCLILFSNDYFSSSEALCRTAVESCVNLYFCSLGDTQGKVLSYLTDYVRQERDQNAKWKRSVCSANYPESASRVHEAAIQRKEQAMNLYENVIRELCSDYGREYADLQGWPNVYDRFSKLGKEVDYRTIYASLCSQSHNDAEDLLNRFISGVSKLENAWERQQRENRDYALFMIMLSLSMLIESTGIYLGKFSINANAYFLPLLERAEKLVKAVSERPSMSG